MNWQLIDTLPSNSNNKPLLVRRAECPSERSRYCIIVTHGQYYHISGVPHDMPRSHALRTYSHWAYIDEPQ